MSSPSPISTPVNTSATTDASASSVTAVDLPVVNVTDGSIASIVTIVLIIMSILAILTRLGTKWVVSRAFHTDDFLASFALVCHIASGALVPVMSSNGLGIDMVQVEHDQLNTFAKALIASDVLFISAVICAKVSITFLFRLISQKKSHLFLGTVLCVFTLVWGVTSIFAIAFACKLPNTWTLTGKCIDRVAFWKSFGAINIITDITFFMLPLYITIPLHMAKSKKAIVLSYFATRLLDIVATGTQLGYVSAFESPNLTGNLSRWIILSQLIQCVTIITSCVPYLRPLLQAFPSGMYGNNDFIRNQTINGSSGQYFHAPDSGYILNHISKESNGIHVSKTVNVRSEVTTHREVIERVM